MKDLSRIIQKSLCGLLSAAMILTSVSIPSVTVFAEEADAEGVVAVAEDDIVATTIEADIEETEEVVEELELAEATSTNFYYYVGDVNDGVEIGAYVWTENGSNFSTTANVASWGVWSVGDTYELTAVDGHAGWYMIPITIVDPSGNTTIEIRLSSSAGTSDNLYKMNIYNGTATGAWNELTSGDYSDVCVKDGSVYSSIEAAEAVVVEYPITITFNYHAEGIDNIDFVWWGSNFSTSDSAVSESLTGSWNATGYRLNKVDGNEGWYTAEFKTNSAGGEGFELWSVKDGAVASETKISKWDNTDIFDAVLALEEGGTISVRNGKYYASIEEADKGYYSLALSNQITMATGLLENEALYSAESFAAMSEKLTAANAVQAKGEEATLIEIKTAYEELKAAIEGLETEKAKSLINVTPVALSSNFITGADLSSYLAIRDSGVVFKDENGNALSDQGFFDYLAAGGTNWVRIRVWNDPYDGSGNGYGGGNNDIDKAVTIGKLATNAGMKVLIDFHYSDFWADPAKYSAPKALKNMSVDEKAAAVSEFTTASLNKLRDAGVDVGMVQVGNETNSGICGETSWENMSEIFKAGSAAVRAVDSDILIAVHYTDPQNGFTKYASKLDDYNVDYDVFGASFYPYWHGTTSQLTESLSAVASTYGKKVMVAETSWATTWEDGDGHENTAPKTSGQSLAYDISVQGQADEMRDVVNAVNNATNGIGVFYWEPAWLSANYVYNADGSIDQKLLSENKAGWEKYGAGWAASYSAEYDPSDAGLWYGGSAIDNQAWFDFDGTALATAKAYALIRTGAEADKAISQIANPDDIEVPVGGIVDYPTEVTVKFNDGTTRTASVKWNADEMALVSTDKLGTYTVSGIATCTYEGANGNVTEKKNISITVSVVATANLLKNPGFESGTTGWTFGGSTPEAASAKPDAGNVRNGSYAINFWFSPASDFTMSQKLENINPGIYTFGAFIQGGSAGSTDKQYSFAEVYDSDNNLKVKYSSKTSLSGWLNWNDPEIKGIKIEEGDYLVVGLKIMSSEDGAWGWIDDAYLYGSHSINVSEDITNGQITLSNYEASAGEVVTVTAKPAAAYKIKNISFIGIDETFVPSVVGEYSAENDTYTIDLEAQNITDIKDVTFTMPETEITVTAEFVSVFGADKVDITDNADVVVTIDTQYATGKAITPVVKAEYKGYVLTTADYSVTFKNNKDVYTYVNGDDEFDAAKAPTAIIKAKGTKFTGTKTVNFVIEEDVRINLADKNNVEVSIASEYDNAAKKSFYYAAEEIEPAVNVNYKDGDEVKTLDASKYDVVYTSNIKPGKATITVVPADDAVSGSAQITFTIEKRPISTLSISIPSGTTYTGKAVKPTVRVKYGNKLLVNGTDYSVAYGNNTKASTGSAYLTVTCKGNYVGKSDKIYFSIKEKNINDAGITMTADTLSAKNADQTAKVNIINTITGKKLAAADYTITTIEKYEDGTGYVALEGLKFRDAGTYRVTVEGKGNYTGERKAVFKVVDAAHNIANVKIATKAKTYTGSTITLSEEELVVSYGAGKSAVTLTKNSDYTVKYTNNQKVGAATVTITGINDYSGTKSATFKINQAKLKSAYVAGEELPDDAADYVQWNIAVTEGKAESTAYTGYAITPSLKVTYGANKNVLVKDKDYTVVYSNNVKSGAKANITIKGKGNYSGSVVVKEAFTVTDRSLADFVISVAPVEYTGKAIKPAITFTEKATGENVDLKAGTAYSVTYKNNTNVAGKNSSKMPTVTIKETGLNGTVAAEEKVTATYAFTITTAAIKDNSVAKIAIQKYNNKPVTPAVTVKVNGRALKVNKDYVVNYANNGKPGTATAVIKGIGNYSGTVSKAFVIK